MAQTKNLCAKISLELYNQVTEAKTQAGQTTNEYITSLLTEYYEMKKTGGTTTMTGKTRTMAFQIPEELFQRIKAHLERESTRSGRKYTQREFVLSLIETALEEAEQEALEETSQPNADETTASPCEDGDDHEDGLPPEKP